jgi:allantoinase
MQRFDRVVAGRVATPTGILDCGWVAIRDGRIAAVGEGAAPETASHDDVGAAFVLPGLIDGQTHAGSYGGLAGLESTTRSAIAGGITTIVDMPYDNPVPLTDAATLAAKIEAIARFAHSDVALYGTVAKEQPVDTVAALVDGGIVALKISAFESHPVRFPRIANGQTLELLEATAATGLPVGLHNEDQEIVLARIAAHKRAGHTAPRFHEPSRPLAAELAATAAFLELGRATRAHVHLVHLSSARGYDLVQRYRDEGVNATAELCVHYLLLDADRDMDRLGARMKVNPPIRGGEAEGLWTALLSKQVAFVSSDHSSWPIDNKLTESIFDAGAGIPGLETLVPALFSGLAERVDDPIAMTAHFLSEQPAKFFGLWPSKGRIAPGADADLVVLAEEDWQFRAEASHDELNWSPFDGQTFRGRIKATYLRGKKVFADGNVLGAPGDGAYVRRDSPPT